MISSNDRFHPMKKSKLTKQLRTLGYCKGSDLVKPETYQPITEETPCTVTVEVSPPTKRRSDSPNWYPTVKAIFDGFTDAGVWDDDNDKIIKEVTFKPVEVNTTGKYIITIKIKRIT